MSADFNLYEFPSDHVGRKTYVSVRGHSRSIPKRYCYLGCDSRYHVLPEYGGDGSGFTNSGPLIIRDMAEYISPLDGSRVTSRSSHRDHMRRHDVIEVGNERVRATASQDMPRVGGDIKRAIEQLRSRG